MAGRQEDAAPTGKTKLLKEEQRKSSAARFLTQSTCSFRHHQGQDTKARQDVHFLPTPHLLDICLVITPSDEEEKRGNENDWKLPSVPVQTIQILTR